MKSLLNVTGISDSSSQDSSISGFPKEEISFADSFSAPVSELSLPGQISLSGSARFHGNARRTVSIHRSAVGFIKSLLVGVAMCASLAMTLPISTPPNALAHSTGIINTRQMAVVGLIVGVVGIVLAYLKLYDLQEVTDSEDEEHVV